jgi:signal transduction histidine kinase
VIGSAFLQRDRMTLRVYGVCSLVNTALLQMFAASLVSLSEPPGSTVLAAVFLLIVGFQSFRFLVTPRYVFAALPTVFAIAVALALNPSRTHLSIFAVTAPAALGAAFLLGGWGLTAARAREERASLRAALQAKVLEEQTRDRDRLAERLLRILEHNHDASTTLSALLMNAQRIHEQTTDETLAPATLHELSAGIEVVRKGLSRLRELLEDARRESAGQVEPPVPVDVVAILGESVREAAASWPEVAFAGRELDGLEGTRVRVAGAELALRRVLQNVLTNACEGDCLRAARNVRVAARLQPEEGMLAIECHDDGPGFRRELLEQGVRAFDTTKSSGTGLGLYTVGSLLRASGGELAIANAPGGGAVVTLQLPTERRQRA